MRIESASNSHSLRSTLNPHRRHIKCEKALKMPSPSFLFLSLFLFYLSPFSICSVTTATESSSPVKNVSTKGRTEIKGINFCVWGVCTYMYCTCSSLIYSRAQFIRVPHFLLTIVHRVSILFAIYMYMCLMHGC